MNRKESLFKNTAILGTGTIVSKVLSFLIIPFFSRWLSVEAYGIFDLFTTYVTLIIPVITLACSEAVFRYLIVASEEKEKNKIVTNSIIVVFYGVCISIIFAFLFNNTLFNGVAAQFTLMMVGETIYYYLQAYLRGERKLHIYAFSGILLMIFTFGFVTLFVFIMKMELKGILLGYGVSYVLVDIIIVIRIQIVKHIKLSSIDFNITKSMIAYSAPMIINTVSWWIMNVSDRSIVDAYLGATSLGIYAIANKVPSICTSLFSVFQVSWQQSAIESMDDVDRDVYYNDVLQKLVLRLVSICVCVISLNFILFDYIFDARYSSGYLFVSILVTAVIISCLSSFFGGIFISFKRSGLNGGTTVITAVMNVVIHILLIKFIGLYAAAISTLAAFVFLFIIRYIFIKTFVKFKWSNTYLIAIIIWIYFIIMQFVNNAVTDWTNIIIAIVIFCAINKDIIAGVYRKILHKYFK
ncbi:MAG: lipopolysaccharide biosynthesis protein [Eubacteriales bacterium]